MGHKVFSVLCQHHLVTSKGHHHPLPELPVAAESLAINPSVVDDVFGEDTLSSMTSSDWHRSSKR